MLISNLTNFFKMFGLIIELESNNHFLIFDNLNNLVGSLNIDNKEITFQANTSFGDLIGLGKENGNLLNFNYQLGKEIKGDCTFKTNIEDNEIFYNNQDKTVEINFSNQSFKIDIINGDILESYKFLANIYSNRIVYFKKDNQTNSLYEKFIKIEEIDNETLEVLVFKDGKEKKYYVTFDKENERSEKGKLMQQLESEFFQEILKIRNILEKDGTFLLDNMIRISLSNFNDEELKNLFGFRVGDFKDKIKSLNR